MAEYEKYNSVQNLLLGISALATETNVEQAKSNYDTWTASCSNVADSACSGGVESLCCSDDRAQCKNDDSGEEYTNAGNPFWESCLQECWGDSPEAYCLEIVKSAADLAESFKAIASDPQTAMPGASLSPGIAVCASKTQNDEEVEFAGYPMGGYNAEGNCTSDCQECTIGGEIVLNADTEDGILKDLGFSSTSFEKDNTLLQDIDKTPAAAYSDNKAYYDNLLKWTLFDSARVANPSVAGATQAKIDLAVPGFALLAFPQNTGIITTSACGSFCGSLDANSGDQHFFILSPINYASSDPDVAITFSSGKITVWGGENHGKIISNTSGQVRIGGVRNTGSVSVSSSQDIFISNVTNTGAITASNVKVSLQNVESSGPIEVEGAMSTVYIWGSTNKATGTILVKEGEFSISKSSNAGTITVEGGIIDADMADCVGGGNTGTIVLGVNARGSISIGALCKGTITDNSDGGVTITIISQSTSEVVTTSQSTSQVTTTPAPTGTPAGTTAVPPPVAEVRMVTELPYTKTQFEAVQDSFIAGVANATGYATDKVVINSVTEKTIPSRRRVLLAIAVDVDFSVQTETEEAAGELASSNKLSETSLNTALAAQNVSPISQVILAAQVIIPTTTTSAPSTTPSPIENPAESNACRVEMAFGIVTGLAALALQLLAY